ncbi:MAG: hypothetical protein KC636_28395, partial [Myxococcales bacterium]|nr:hypothetical protein [Myxococcales bacterium]
MPARFPDPPRLRRDGTSQAARSLPALDPAYAPVDERGPREWLAFTRQLARALRFHDPAQPGVELDWSGFVGEDVDLERVVAYMQDPDAATPAEVERFSRPHFALLLTFLELLGHARDQLNTLTRRHLEFYFERALGMTRSAPAPDRVNVLLQPAAGVAAHLVPSGTDLLAGTGIDGAPLRYRTDHDLIVTRATVAELRTVYAELRRTGLREARTRRDPGTNAEGRFLRMFEYALGEPGIGDPLPPFEGAPVTFATLVALGERIAFARDGLGMELYELREVMRLYDRRLADDASWAQINALLAAAGKRRDPSFQGPAPSSRAFAANLNAAVGQELSAASFAGLPEVTSVDTLYQKRLVERDGYGVAA